SAHRRHGAVQHREQRTLPIVLAQGADQLQASACDLVKREKVVGSVRLQPANVAELSLERLLNVLQQSAGGWDGRVAIIEAESGQRVDPEMLKEDGASCVSFERPVRPGGHAHRWNSL